MAKKALLVGINDYEGDANDLPSCKNDVQHFGDLLRSDGFGFRSNNIQTLTDSEATTTAVVDGLKTLMGGAKEGDVLVFFYSGHGYSAPKNDVLEEYLVFHDDLFLDDRLIKLTQDLPDGVLLTVFLDSCFSGGMEKRMFSLVEDARVRNKVWHPPLETLARDIESEKSVKQFRAFGGPPVKTVSVATSMKEFRKAATSDEAGQLQMKGLLIAACSETETAAASTAQTNGMSAFTYCFLDAISSQGSDKSIDEIMQATNLKLRDCGFGQKPVVKCLPTLAGLKSKPFLASLAHGSAAAAEPATAMTDDDISTIAAIIAVLFSMPSADKRFGLLRECDEVEFPHNVSRFRKDGSMIAEKRWTDVVETALAVYEAMRKNGAGNGQAVSSGADKRWTDFVQPALLIMQALQEKGFNLSGGFSTPVGSGGFTFSQKGILDNLEPVILIARQLASMNGEKGWLQDGWRSIERETRRAVDSIKPEDVQAVVQIATAIAGAL